MITRGNHYFSGVAVATLLSVLILGSIANGALLEYEGFNYSSAILNNQSGGDGWGGAWLDSDTDAPLSNDGSSLAYPQGVFHTPSGSRILFSAAGEAERTLGTSMNLAVEGSVFYFSALAKRNGDFLFEFIDNSGNVRWRMGGQSANNAALLGVSANYPANNLFPPGETVYIVGKIVTHSSANDQVYLNIYRQSDTVPSTEPASWMASTNGASGVTLTRLQIRNITATALEVDEIRIGTNYQEVVIGTPQGPPIIASQPVSVTNYEGMTAVFYVSATGLAPLNYQWRKDGVDLPYQTNTTLVISNIQLSDSGEYTVVVSNSLGTITSSPAILNVIQITGIETGLRAKWSLDEKSGLIAMDSGPYQLNGALYNFPTGDSQWVNGIINGGLMFGGANYIEVPDNAKIGGDLVYQFSISAWINSRVFLSTNGNTYRCFEKGDNIFLLQGDGNTNNVGTGGMNFAVKKNNQIYTASIYDALDSNRWYHIVGTYDGNTIRVYVDGIMKGTRNVTAPIDDDKLPLRIGSDDSGKYFNGMMDEVCIWDRPLRESEIAYLAGKTGPARIVSQPQPAAVTQYAGTTLRITVAAFGSEPIRYLWYKGTNELRDATSNTLILYDLQPDDAGEYRCRVSNSEGTNFSDAVSVQVIVPSNINDAAVALWHCNEGWSYLLEDSTTNSYNGELRDYANEDYGWFPKDGNDYALAFDGNLNRVVITNSASLSAGTEATFAFWLYPSNYGTLTTGQLYNTARGRILNKGSYIDIQIVDDPGSVRQTLIANGVSAPQKSVELNKWQHFAIVFKGGKVTFYKNGFQIGESTAANLGAATQSFLVLGNVSDQASPASYYSGLMDDIGIWSRPLQESEILELAGLDASGPPQIVTQPVSASKYEGSSATLLVEATGKRPMNYQWYLNDNPLPNSNTNKLVLTNLTSNNAGVYFVVVQNELGSATSQAANLIVKTFTNITSGLVAYWTFDETEGNVFHDSSGNGHDAVLQNGVAVANTQGVVGGAYNFDGIDDFAIVPHADDLNMYDQLSISFWVNPRTISVVGGLSRIVKKDVNYDISLEDSRDSLRFYGLNKAIYDAPANVVVTNEWQHFALVLNNGFMQFYKNGRPIGNPVPAQLGPASVSELIIANYGTDLSINRLLNGYLDELAIWQRPLTATEIDHIYQNGLLGKPLTAEYVQFEITSLTITNKSTAILTFNTPYNGRDYAIQTRRSFAVAWSFITNAAFTRINQSTVEAVFNIGTNDISFFRVAALPPGALFMEDFESGAQGWTHGGAGDNWEVGTPLNGPMAAHSGTNVYATGLNSNIQPFSDCYLRSPIIDLTSVTSATLSFYEWRNIDTSIWYHSVAVNVLDPATMSVIAELYSNAGATSGWEKQTIKLPDTAVGREIMLEFRLRCDDFNLLEGWYIDDVVITH
ncbi:MAG: LamG-like jellyroll fold domain-containing protein [Verrucomicrobiia bacterium]